MLSESLARARSAKIVRSRDPLTRIESRDRIAVSVKRPVEVWPQLSKMLACEQALCLGKNSDPTPLD